MSHRLLNGRRHVLITSAVVDLGRQAVLDDRVVREELECPSELRGRRLVSGDENRGEAVAHLVIGQWKAVWCSSRDKRIEHVPVMRIVASPFDDERGDEIVDPLALFGEHSPCAVPAWQVA
ncbi:MAG TPA: hypothetical protein VNV42_08465 [Solirubrobacteraceae bacterium]|nr:hypothetical protein [Solirubrobacteraceae bacterium]